MEEKKVASVIQPTLSVSAAHWVISLLIRPDSKNPEHTFLLVEGLDDIQQARIFRKYDFVMNQEPAKNVTAFSKQYPGAIQIREDRGCLLANYPKQEHQDYFKRYVFSKHTQGFSWILSKQLLEKLDTRIRAEQGDASAYHISGESASTPKLSSQSGHNCYTWARRQLIRLDPIFETKLPNSFMDLLAAYPSRHLNTRDDHDQSTPQTCLIL